MKEITLVIACFFGVTMNSCESQPNSNQTYTNVGGPCEGCEAALEYDSSTISFADTLPGYLESDNKLFIHGTVFEADGKTPAEDVVLYFYHTDQEGLYSKAEGATGWAYRHGQHRGWVKTGANGRYNFYTFRPAAYPGGVETEHIHITVLEPDKNPYYIDEIVFDDDPLLTQEERSKLDNRGGSGIVRIVPMGKFDLAERNIYLGEHIPGYPK